MCGERQPSPARQSSHARAVTHRRGLLPAGPVLVAAVLLASCLPEPASEPTTAATEVIGATRLETVIGGSTEQTTDGVPLTLLSLEEFEDWAETALDAEQTEAAAADLSTVDLKQSVLAVEVFDACDRAVRFVAGEPGEVIVDHYDPTPESSHLCEAPEITLVVAEVGIDEVGAESPSDVRIRRGEVS